MNTFKAGFVVKDKEKVDEINKVVEKLLNELINKRGVQDAIMILGASLVSVFQTCVKEESRLISFDECTAFYRRALTKDKELH